MVIAYVAVGVFLGLWLFSAAARWSGRPEPLAPDARRELREALRRAADAAPGRKSR